MSTNFPGSLDSLSNPSGANYLDDGAVVHADQHANANDAIEALQAKLGTGASTPSAGKVLRGTGAGASSYGQVDVTTDVVGFTSAQLAALLSDETGSGAAVFGTSPTIVTPTIASFTNAQHNHSNAAGGGVLGNGVVTNAMLAANAAWTDWTPTLTNFTLGNGTVVAKYQQIGKTVHFRFVFTLGSTSAVGSSPTISLPVTAAAFGHVSSGAPAIGWAHFEDNTVAGYGGYAYMASTTTIGFAALPAGGAYLTATGITAAVPFSFGTGDEITAVGTYEAA